MKDVTYGQFVCTVRPEKAEPNRTRFTVGGDRVNYPGAVATPTAEMLVAKMLFNSVISTKDARFMTMDISNFYLMTPLHRPKFIRMKLSDIPDKVIRRIQATRESHQKWQHLHQNQSQARGVRPTTIRIISKRTP